MLRARSSTCPTTASSRPATGPRADAGWWSSRPTRRAARTAEWWPSGSTPAGCSVLRPGFEVANVGNVTISGIQIDDPLLADAGVAVTCTPGRLAPGESVVCTSQAYTVTAADERRGRVRNVATVNGEDLSGSPVTPPPADQVE